MSSNIFGSLANTISGLLSPHGPASEAAMHSYAPGDLSVHFFLQLAVILLACRVVGWLGKKMLGQPQVVGEMIAGVVLGPSLLGLLFPDLQAAFFPPQTRNVLYVGAQFGVGLYMFLVGTTLRTEHFRSKARSAMGVSLAGIVTPFLLAVLITPMAASGPRPVRAGHLDRERHPVHGRVHRAHRISDAGADHQRARPCRHRARYLVADRRRV
jgi:hypothetical protein